MAHHNNTPESVLNAPKPTIEYRHVAYDRLGVLRSMNTPYVKPETEPSQRRKARAKANKEAKKK